MRLQLLPEIVGTERRVSEVVRQRIPGYRTGDGERPTAERVATMSWYDKMVAAGRSKSLTTGNVRCEVAAVHEVLGSLALPCLSVRLSRAQSAIVNITVCCTIFEMFDVEDYRLLPERAH